MKTTKLFKIAFLILFCGFSSWSFAADWYISSAGNDGTGNGSAGSPWASFSKAQTSASSNDIIHVSGMIDMWSETANSTFTQISATPTYSTTNKTGIAIAKNLTILGTSPATDGFNGTNGSNSTRFFQLGAFTLTLKNLKLANGVATTTLATVVIGGGAIAMTNGNIVAENVVFDGNSATGHNAITGGAIYIGGTNTTGTSFKNCIFSNNIADKDGAIYINNWAAGTSALAPSIIKFEGCSFIGNEAKTANGGSALFIRSQSDYTTCNIINCTFAKNKVSNTGNGGTIYMGARSQATTIVNIINSTITENTTLGAATTGAGVVVLSKSGNFIGTLNIYNSIIENNTAPSAAYSDLAFSNVAPIAPGVTTTVPALFINNSIVGRYGSPSLTIPGGCIGATNYFNAQSGSVLDGKLGAFNSSLNFYPLQSGSPAISYGASSFLSSLSPSVSTDQLGNTRPFSASKCNAGSVEIPDAPSVPTALVATAGDAQLSVAFNYRVTGGPDITNYKYSTDGTTFVACSPAKISSPIVITGLTNASTYSIKLKAVNVNGDGAESFVSNTVTPDATANDIAITTATNVSALVLTPVSDLVVSSNVLTVNQPATVNSVTVAPGAKLDLSTNSLSLTGDLVLQAGKTTAPSVSVTSGMTIGGNVILQKTMSSGVWYFMSFPSNVIIDNITHTGTGPLTLGTNWWIKYYDGASRAVNSGASSNWKPMTSGQTLAANQGYIIAFDPSLAGDHVLSFPMDKAIVQSAETGRTVSVTNYGEGVAGANHVGWNLVGSPYLSKFGGSGVNASFLNFFNGTTYDQSANTAVSSINPFDAFFIQASGTTANLTFELNSRQLLKNVVSTQESDNIELKIASATGVDKTTLLLDNAYTTDYVINQDLEKWITTGTDVPQLYTQLSNVKYAFNALPVDNVDNLALGYYSKNGGSTTIGINAAQASSLSGLLLTDNNTGTTTDLMVQDYTFTSDAGTTNNRFVLKAKRVATDNKLIADGATKTSMSVINCTLILNNITNKTDVSVFDAIGRFVSNKTASGGSIEIKLPAKGIYIIQLENNIGTKTIKIANQD